MAQNELHLRLLKDGKIVGYEKKCFWNEPTEIFTFQQEINSKDWIMDSEFIKYDSFELRSPFRDENGEWLWEGDIVLISHEYEDAQKKVMKFLDGNFILSDFNRESYMTMWGVINQDYTIEKIGTIHDGWKV